MLKLINWPAVFAVFGVTLLLVVCWRTMGPTLDSAQEAFEREHAQFPWAEWKRNAVLKPPSEDADSQVNALRCRSRDTVRSCSALIENPPHPSGAHTGLRLLLFVCSTTDCDWVLEDP